jgi:hypothetical protein
MDQANFQPWRGSAPILFNQQQGDDPESVNLAGFQSFATPPGASLPPGVGFEQSPGVSMLPSPDFSGFVTTGISLPSPGFSCIPDVVSLVPSQAYIDFEQSLDASLIPSPANYAALPGFEEAPITCPCAACTSFEQLPSGDLYHAALSGCSACIRYGSQTNEPSLPQPQSNYGDILKDFSDYALFNQAILPPNSAHRECHYPANDQNPEQDVTSNLRPKPQRCLWCRKLKRTVFLSS